MNYTSKRHHFTFDEFTDINDSALDARAPASRTKTAVSIDYKPTSPKGQLMFRYSPGNVRTL
jgi:hypothetical protein